MLGLKPTTLLVPSILDVGHSNLYGMPTDCCSHRQLYFLMFQNYKVILKVLVGSQEKHRFSKVTVMLNQRGGTQGVGKESPRPSCAALWGAELRSTGYFHCFHAGARTQGRAGACLASSTNTGRHPQSSLLKKQTRFPTLPPPIKLLVDAREAVLSQSQSLHPSAPAASTHGCWSRRTGTRRGSRCLCRTDQSGSGLSSCCCCC